ncbi:MAG: DUF305 domain-containing protein [Steroidobacteraceae bacterium]
MNARTIAAFVLGAAVATAAGQAVTRVIAQEDHSHHVHTSTPVAEAHPFVSDMDRDMAKMMTDMHAPGYTGNWDIDFLAMMVPHHQGAIDMARLVLIHGKDPLTRTLAEDIIASQQVEIYAMTARLEALRKGGSTDPSQEFPTLSGTRGTASGN